ncbi:hypothetical protein [Xanthobacter sp. NFM-26]|nr:hypothetical protein [Xanthobacter sp. NFM-26]
MDYLYVIAVSLVLAVVTVFVHMYALYVVRIGIRRLLKMRSFNHHVMRDTVVVSGLMVALCSIHIFEIVLWAIGYVSIGAFSDMGNATYFSLTMYTTVGPDGLSISKLFRGIAGFESLLGPMMVAWSTAFLVEYVTAFRAQERAEAPK